MLSYLLAGCPAAVACLWTVTDEDMNRFTESLLDMWLLNKKSAAADLDGGGGDEQCSRSLAEVIPRARRKCKLPYLNGGATVCYGVPVYRKGSSRAPASSSADLI